MCDAKLKTRLRTKDKNLKSRNNTYDTKRDQAFTKYKKIETQENSRKR